MTKEMRKPYPYGPSLEFDGALEFNGVMMQADRPMGSRTMRGLTMADLMELQENSLKSSSNTEDDVSFRGRLRDEMLRRERLIERVIELLEEINEKLTK